MQPPLILFLCILLVFLISRVIAYAVLVWHVLPQSVLSSGRRPHHFVYGNILIVAASFAVIALGVPATHIAVMIAYGIGLGLVLDEFPHWMGNEKELRRNVPVVRGGLIATIVALAVLLLCTLIL